MNAVYPIVSKSSHREGKAMKRSIIETVLGAVVLIAAAVFLSFSYSTANVGSVSGYTVKANFSGIGGLGIGDDVQISGVKVGSVSKVELGENYLATVSMSVAEGIRLPDDTAAFISSESLLGGRFLQLEPGASDVYLEDGDVIQYTQAPQNLEQLLGKFIFSMQGNGNGDAAEQGSAQASQSLDPSEEQVDQ